MSFDNDVLCVRNYCADFNAFSWKAVTITNAQSPYTATDQAIIIEANVASGPVTIQLSTVARYPNQVIFIRKVDATNTGNPVTILPQTGYTVLGGASAVLTRHHEILHIYRDTAFTDWKTLTNRIDQISPTSAKGDLLVHNGTQLVRLPVGANGLSLTTDSSEPTGVKWTSVIGAGDVIGPGSSTDNAIARFDGTTGKIIQNSGITIDDSNNMSGANNIAVSGTVDGRDVSVDGANLDAHIANLSNPHNVTAAQVGNTTAQWNANKIQGTNVSSTAPTNGQLLSYNGGTSQWEPTTTINMFNWGVERITAIGGGAAVSPTLTKNLTFITTTGAGTATGTLASGALANDGLEKILMGSALACPYALTVTSMIDAVGSAGSKVLRFDNSGQSAVLIWNHTIGRWLIKNAGVTVI